MSEWVLYHTHKCSCTPKTQQTPSRFISDWMVPFKSMYRMRESFLTLIYRVSGLDEPFLDVSPTPTCLQFISVSCNTLDHMLAYMSLSMKKRCCLVTMAGHFHHHTSRKSPCVITCNGCTGGFSHMVLPLLSNIATEVLSWWQSRPMNYVIIWGDTVTVKPFSIFSW